MDLELLKELIVRFIYIDIAFIIAGMIIILSILLPLALWGIIFPTNNRDDVY